MFYKLPLKPLSKLLSTNILFNSIFLKIQNSIYFVRSFDQPLREARRPLGEKQVHVFTRKAFHSAQLIKEFKLDMLTYSHKSHGK